MGVNSYFSDLGLKRRNDRTLGYEMKLYEHQDEVLVEKKNEHT